MHSQLWLPLSILYLDRGRKCFFSLSLYLLLTERVSEVRLTFDINQVYFVCFNTNLKMGMVPYKAAELCLICWHGRWMRCIFPMDEIFFFFLRHKNKMAPVQIKKGSGGSEIFQQNKVPWSMFFFYMWGDSLAQTCRFLSCVSVITFLTLSNGCRYQLWWHQFSADSNPLALATCLCCQFCFSQHYRD